MNPDVHCVGVTALAYLGRSLAHMGDCDPVLPSPEETSYPVNLAVVDGALTIDGHFYKAVPSVEPKAGLIDPYPLCQQRREDILLMNQSGPLLRPTIHRWRERALPPIAFIPDQLRHLRYLLCWHLSSLWNRICWIICTSNSAIRCS